MEFIKSYRDNPKINAIVLIKVIKQRIRQKGNSKINIALLINSELQMRSYQGTLEDFPKLAPLPVEPEEDEVADDLKVSSCVAFE